MNVSQLRVLYSNEVIMESSVDPNPFSLFTQWFDIASKTDSIQEPNAMCLSTATPTGRPSSRFVLMKSFSNQGVKFYSNYNSRKGLELSQNPQACLLFYWPPLHRQVRIEGIVSRLSDEESTDYFNTRPKSSQSSASISAQSQPVSSRTELEEKWKGHLESYSDRDIPRPSHWGGYLLEPDYFEFWQGHSTRLHDRICFKKKKDIDTWPMQRLYP